MKKMIIVVLAVFITSSVVMAELCALSAEEAQVRYNKNLPTASLSLYYSAIDADMGLGYSRTWSTAAITAEFPFPLGEAKTQHTNYAPFIIAPSVALVTWGTSDANEFGEISLGANFHYRYFWSDRSNLEVTFGGHGDIRRNLKEFETDPTNPYNPNPSLSNGLRAYTAFAVKPHPFDLSVRFSGRFYPSSMYTFKRVYQLDLSGSYAPAYWFNFGGGMEIQYVPKVSTNEEVGFTKYTPFVSLGLTPTHFFGFEGRLLMPDKANYESLGFDAQISFGIW